MLHSFAAHQSLSDKRFSLFFLLNYFYLKRHILYSLVTETLVNLSAYLNQVHSLTYYNCIVSTCI